MSIQPINGVVDAYFNQVYDVLGSLSTYPSYPLGFQSHVVGVDGMKLMCMGTHHVSIWMGAQTAGIFETMTPRRLVARLAMTRRCHVSLTSMIGPSVQSSTPTLA